MRAVHRRLRLFLRPVWLGYPLGAKHELQRNVHGPTLGQAALMTVVGYLLGFGVPFVSFYVLPKLFVANNAAQTSQNILANQGLFVAAIFAMLLNFIGDVLAAWGLYVLLRPVNSSISMLAAWFRVVYATIGIAALLNLVTAYGLLTRPDYLTVFGRGQLDAQVQLAVDSFNFQFAFGLIVFGVYFVILGLLVVKSGYIPKWLGVVLVIDGAGWILTEAVPYLLPQANLGFLIVTSFGELVLLAWLVGWGRRLKEPIPEATVPPGSRDTMAPPS